MTADRPSNVRAELRVIWAELLEVPDVDGAENFFAAGGNSLLATVFAARCSAVGIDLAVREIFAARSFNDLCAMAGERQRRAGDVPRDASGQAGVKNSSSVEDKYPLSALQEGMLVEIERSEDQAVYHIVSTYAMSGLAALSAERFEAGVASLVAAHPILRTTFDLAADDGPTQLVWAAGRKIDVEYEDFSGSDKDEVRALTRTWRERARLRAFQVTDLPLFSMCFYKDGPTSGYLNVTHSHVILDGWSLTTLINELETYLRGGEIYRPARNVFKEFVLLEREEAADTASRDFWRREVRSCHRTTFARRTQIKAEPYAYEATCSIPGPVVDSARRLADKVGLPVKSAFMAAYMCMLAALTGQTAVSTGLVCNGRPEVLDADKAVGLFLNTVVAGLDLQGKSAYELVERCFEKELELLDYRRYPFAAIRKLPGFPSVDASFGYIDFSKLGFAKFYERVEEFGVTEVPLMASPTNDTMVLYCRSSHFSEAQSGAMVACMAEALARISSEPDEAALALARNLRAQLDAAKGPQ